MAPSSKSVAISDSSSTIPHCDQTGVDACTIAIEDPLAISPEDRHKLADILNRHNFVLYQTDSERFDAAIVMSSLSAQLGLVDQIKDKVHPDDLEHGSDHNDPLPCKIANATNGDRKYYIPFTDKALNWHTDGYYNDSASTVRSFLLHCETPASIGGENAVVNHELVYALIRKRNPAWIDALQQSDCFTIPVNDRDPSSARGAFSGPVFAMDSLSNRLLMRYTQRRRHIEWQDDRGTHAALAYLEELLSHDCQHIVWFKLRAGQGIICNNVLHRRSAFTDGPGTKPRTFYRLRFGNRIDPFYNCPEQAGN